MNDDDLPAPHAWRVGDFTVTLRVAVHWDPFRPPHLLPDERIALEAGIAIAVSALTAQWVKSAD